MRVSELQKHLLADAIQTPRPEDREVLIQFLVDGRIATLPIESCRNVLNIGSEEVMLEIDLSLSSPEE